MSDNEQNRAALRRQVEILSKANKKRTPDLSEGVPITYDTHNKLHWLLGGVSYSTRVARDTFAKDFDTWVADTRSYCEQQKIPCELTNELYGQVINMLGKCKSFYEVEALARFVFDDHVVPDHFESVAARAQALYNAMPIWDAAKQKRQGLI